MKAKVNTMPGPKPPEIKLTDEEQQGLEKLVRRHNTPQQIALRGRIVLAAADGQNNTQIAKKLGIVTNGPYEDKDFSLSPREVH
jgi:DNA-binding NarL/FixJ family response regulator